MKLKILAPFLIYVLLAGFAFAAVYADVSPNHWAYDSVIRLTDLGILSGISEGGLNYFKGNDPLTRYQAAVLLDKFLTYLGEKIISGTSGAVSDETIGKIREQIGLFETLLKDQKGEYIDLADVLGRLEKLEKEVADLQSKGTVSTLPEGTDLRKFFDKLQSFGESVADLKRDLEGQLDELSKNVSNLEGTVNTTLAEIESELGTLNKRVRGHSEEISGISGRVTSAEKEIATLENKVDSLWNLTSNFAKKEELKGLEDKMEGIEAELSSFVTGEVLDSRLEGYATVKDLDALKDEVASELEDMNVNVSGLQVEVLGLKERLDDVENTFVSEETFSASMSELEGKFNNLEATLEEVFGDGYLYFVNLIDDVTNHGKRINNLEDKIAALDALKNEVEELKASTDDLQRDIGNLKKLKTDVANLNRAVTELNSKIEQLDNELTALKESVPSNARLTTTENMAQAAFWVGIVGVLVGVVAALLTLSTP